MDSLKQQFEDIAERYIKRFCKKEDLEYNQNNWQNNEIGTVYQTNNFCISFEDIRINIDQNKPKGHFQDYYQDFISSLFSQSHSNSYKEYL